MRRFGWLLMSLAALGLFCVPVAAAESLKVGVVDLQRCIMDSTEGKRVKDELQKKKDAMQQKLDERQSKLVQFKKELDKQSMMLSMDAKEDKAKEFERQRREFKYFYDDLVQQMRKTELEAKKKLVRELEKVISKIGKEGKYDLILERRTSGIMHYSKALDITDEVTKAYDRSKQ